MQNHSGPSADSGQSPAKPTLVNIHSYPTPIAAPTEQAKPNFLRSALEKREFICTAELVLGRDHNVAEAEAFVKEAAQQADGIQGHQPDRPSREAIRRCRRKLLFPTSSNMG